MPRKPKIHIPKNIQFFLYSMLLLVGFHFMHRLTLYLLNAELAESAATADIIYGLFNIGPRFDIYVSLIILLIPFFIASIPFLANRPYKPWLKAANLILILLAVLSIWIAITDLGFFRYYNARITKTIFDWTNEPGVMFSVMLGDTNYLLYSLIFMATSLVYVFLQSKIIKRVLASADQEQYTAGKRAALFTGMLILIFFSLRGSFNFYAAPLNIDDGFYSENLFLNQLSLNPAYNLVHSYSEVDIEYYENDDEYIDAALMFLNRERSKKANPFETQIYGHDSLQPNIILIFLESMSNAMVSRYNQENQTTPNLDHLALEGIVFDNFYSAGVHTHNAITSTFYGLPAVMNNRPMHELSTANMIFYGMPWILKEKGYENTFYVTGSKKFDNMDDFLLGNGFDRVIGQKDYPEDSMYNSWGVTDKTMFNRVLHECDQMYASGTKFFSSILTISAHEGYKVPKKYKKLLKNKKYPYDIYEYSDILFGEFISQAKTKAWFDKTIFVIVGDHGQNFSAKYDLNLNYHQVPLIFYSPAYFEHLVYDEPGIQQDIYPTLFGLIGLSYVNNGLGVDLFQQSREYAYFSADTKLGIIDDEHFLIYREHDNISMFLNGDDLVKDIYPQNAKKAEKMMDYGFSMVQSAKYLIDNKLTGTSTQIQSNK